MCFWGGGWGGGEGGRVSSGEDLVEGWEGGRWRGGEMEGVKECGGIMRGVVDGKVR